MNLLKQLLKTIKALVNLIIFNMWSNKKDKSTKYGTWHTAYFCINCDKELSSDDRFEHKGRCPKCGFKDPSTRTITKCAELRRREVVIEGLLYHEYLNK